MANDVNKNDMLVKLTQKVFTSLLDHGCNASECQCIELFRNIPNNLLKSIYLEGTSTLLSEPKLPFDTTLQDRVFGSLQCGKPAIDVTKAIVNGNDAPEKAWPWQVLLEIAVNKSIFSCGGALISKTWVLTAAHCIITENISVKLGGKKQGTNIQTFGAKKIIVHKDYNDLANSDDLALIRLNKDVIFNDHVKPICLPRFGSRLESDEFCYATGFGSLDVSAKIYPETLQQIKVNIMHPSLCSYTLRMDARTLCLDLNDNNKGLCHGDSGGPLACKFEGRYELVGIASFGMLNCSATLNGGVLMRVSEYVDWIVTNIAEADI